MVFAFHGEMFFSYIQGRTLRHSPADQDTIVLQAKIIVQLPGLVFLHDEMQRAFGFAYPKKPWRSRTFWLRGLAEFSLAVIFFQAHAIIIPHAITLGLLNKI